MRTMSRLLLLSLALLSACGGSGGPPPPPPPPPPPGDVAIDPTVASAAAANLSSLAASLAASSPQNAQAAQAAAALLASGTHATPVTIAASFRADPPAREALTAGQALAFGTGGLGSGGPPDRRQQRPDRRDPGRRRGPGRDHPAGKPSVAGNPPGGRQRRLGRQCGYRERDADHDRCDVLGTDPWRHLQQGDLRQCRIRHHRLYAPVRRCHRLEDGPP